MVEAMNHLQEAAVHIRGKLLAGALAIGAMAAAAQAQQAPVDLVTVPAVPTDYVPKTTPWGDPDLRGRWPIDHLNGTPLQRTPEQGNRMFLSDEEMEERRRRIEAAAARYDNEDASDRLGQ